MRFKKSVVSVFILSFILVCLSACGSNGSKEDSKKQNLEEKLLAGHSWGETENESKSIGMEYNLFGLKARFTSKAIHNDKNEMGEMYYCFTGEDNDDFSIDKYYEIVDIFTEELGEPIETTESNLTYNTWYAGTLKYVVEFRDADSIGQGDNIIYIDLVNDKYVVE